MRNGRPRKPDGSRIDGRPLCALRRGTIYDSSTLRTVDFDELRACLFDRGYELLSGDEEEVRKVATPVVRNYMSHTTPDMKGAMVSALTSSLSPEGAAAFVTATTLDSTPQTIIVHSGDEESPRRRSGKGPRIPSRDRVATGLSPINKLSRGGSNGAIAPSIREYCTLSGTGQLGRVSVIV